MSIPTNDAPWATDANYPVDAAPESGSPTKVALTGQDTVGYRPDEIPDAMQDNHWRHRVGLWTTYLKSVTTPKWKWLSCSAGTILPTNAPHGTITIGASAGFFGEAAQINYISKEIDLPVGARVLKVGIRFRHTAGEANGGVIGAVQAYKHNAPANGTNAANPPTLLAANPPAAVSPSANTLEVLGNNAAGAKWETITVDLSSAADANKIADLCSYTLVGMCSGTCTIESIGYQYQIEE